MSQTNHLIRRGGVWYYRRRVPLALVAAFGKKIIQVSLGTSDLNEAKKRRAVEDLKCSAQFEAANKGTKGNASSSDVCTVPVKGPPLSEQQAIRRVQNYVACLDELAKQSELGDPPESEGQRHQVRENIETEIAILQNRDDPRAEEWIDATVEKLVNGSHPTGGSTLTDVRLAEVVRRGLLELGHRRLGRLDGSHGVSFFDSAFDPNRMPEVTFGEMARQLLDVIEEEAAINRTSLKWVDKQRASVALLSEIIGTNTPLRQVDYDACMRVRSVLARLPANRSKIYSGLSIENAIAAAEGEDRPALSPATQQVYLATLREILDLGLKKRLIAANPADGLKPLKKDTVAASAKRRPFTPEQLRQFFEGKYYQTCAQHAPAWAYDKQGWRFWMPLLCLFMGMRPNEVCQMGVADVRHTEKGTCYLDVVASTDEDDDLRKVLKTTTSRRRIPVHPELMAVGFLAFVDAQRKSGAARLFPQLKADSYGNYAKYALKRFRESFLPAEINLEPRQSYYGFRHNFRDALRAVGAPPDALQALGGWSQGKLTSDDYGDKSNPDYQNEWMKRIEFPSLNLSHLYVDK